MRADMEKTRPVSSLEEVKSFLKIEHSAEDHLLAAFVLAATETVEVLIGQILIEREMEEPLEIQGRHTFLLAEPVRRLIVVGRDIGEEGELLLDSTQAHLWIDRYGGGRLEVKNVADWRGLLVRYKAGLAETWNGVPEAIRLAVVRLASHFYSYRDDAVVPGVPLAVRQMLAPWRVRRLT